MSAMSSPRLVSGHLYKNLVKAIEHRQAAVLGRLITQGADLSYEGSHGFLLLLARQRLDRAVALRDPTKVSACENIVSILQGNLNSQLYNHVVRGDATQVELLGRAGADLYQQGIDGTELGLLEVAVNCDINSDNVIAVLLEGNRLNQTALLSRRSDGCSLYDLAKLKGIDDVIKLVYERLGNAFLIAAAEGDVSTYDRIRSLGVSANYSSAATGETSILAAVRRSQRRMVERILGDGVDLEVQGADGQTVFQLCNDPHAGVDGGVKKLIEKCLKARRLHAAVCIGKQVEEISRLIADEGCDVNARDSDGNTPLILAVREERLEAVVSYLLDVQRADPNVRNHDGFSALQMAVKCGNMKSLQALLANSSTSMLCKGTTIIEIAQNEGNSAIVGVLVDALRERLWNALEMRDIDMLTELLSCGADINCREQGLYGLTPLCSASRENDTEMIDWLFNHGADINMADEQGTPPVGHAANAGNLESVTKLRELGADVDKPNGEGDSPLALSVASGHVPVARYLIACGVDMEKRNTSGKTPLEVARPGNDDMDKYIRSLQFDQVFEDYSETTATSADILEADFTDSQPARLERVASLQPIVFQANKRKAFDEVFQKVKRTATGKLWSAVSKGNASGVVKALLDGADIYYSGGSGRTVVDEARFVLANVDCDLLTANRFRKPGLLKKKNGLLEVLVELDKHIRKTLLTVVQNGSPEELQQLHNISPTSLGFVEGDPLGLVGHLAVSQDNVAVMDYLVRAETIKPALLPTADGPNAAALEMCNNQGNCPYTLAEEKGHTQVADYIAGVLSVKLAQAVKLGQARRVEMLLKRGARPVYQLHDTSSMAHCIVDAVKSGNAVIVELLIQHGASLETEEGFVVDMAQEHGHTSVYQLLEKEVLNRDLFAAAAKGDLDEVKRLHRKGASLNATIYQRDTIATTAVRSGNLRVVHYLVSHGSSLVHSSQSGEGAMKIAQKTGKTKLCDYVSTALYEELKAAIGVGDIERMDLLYKAGVDVDLHGASGDTALTLAVKKQGQQFVQWLLERGAEVNKKDANGDYSLTLAADKGDYATVSYLLDKGANRSVVNAANMTAVDIAQQQGHSVIVDLLGKDSLTGKQTRENTTAAGKKQHAYTNVRLQEAACKGQVKVIDEFISEEYDRTEKMHLCEQLLYLSRQHGQKQIEAKLFQHLEDLKLNDSSLRKLTGTKQTQQMLTQVVEQLSSLVAHSTDAAMDSTGGDTYQKLLDVINEKNARERDVLNEMDSVRKMREQYQQYCSDLEKDLNAIKAQAEQMTEQQKKIQRDIEERETILSQKVAPQVKVAAYDELREMRQQMAELQASQQVVLHERKRRVRLQEARDMFIRDGDDGIKKNAFLTTVRTILESVLISSKAAVGGMVSVEEKIHLLGVTIPFRPVDVVTGFLTRTCSKLQRSRTSHVAKGIACLATVSEMGGIAEETAVRLTLWYAPQIDMVISQQGEQPTFRETMSHPASQLAEYAVGCIVDALYDDVDKHFTPTEGLAEQFVATVVKHKPRRLKIFKGKLDPTTSYSIRTPVGLLPLHEVFSCSGIRTSEGALWALPGVDCSRFRYSNGTKRMAEVRGMDQVGSSDETPESRWYMSSRFLGETEEESAVVNRANSSSTYGSQSVKALVENTVFNILEEEKLLGGNLQKDWAEQLQNCINRSDATIEVLDRTIHSCEISMEERAKLTDETVERGIKQQEESLQQHKSKVQSQLRQGMEQLNSKFEEWRTETDRFVSKKVELLDENFRQVQQTLTDKVDQCTADITDHLNAYCDHLDQRSTAVDDELVQRQRQAEALVQNQVRESLQMIQEQHRKSMKQLESRYQVIEGKLKQSQEEQWQQLNKHQQTFEDKVEEHLQEQWQQLNKHQQTFEHKVEQHLQENQEQMESTVSAMNSLEMVVQELKQKSEIDECKTAVDDELVQRRQQAEALIQNQARDSLPLIQEQHLKSMEQLEPRYLVVEEQMKQSQEEQWRQLNRSQQTFEHKVEQHLQENREQMESTVSAMKSFEMLVQELKQKSEVAAAVDDELVERRQQAEVSIENQARESLQMIQDQHRKSMEQLELRYQVIDEQMKQSQEERWQQLNKRQQAFEHRVEQHLQENREQMENVVSAMNSFVMLAQEVKQKSEVDECATAVTDELVQRRQQAEGLIENQIIKGQMKQSQEELWQQLHKRQQAFEHEVEQHPQETQEQMESVVSAMNSLEMLVEEVKQKSEVDECATALDDELVRRRQQVEGSIENQARESLQMIQEQHRKSMEQLEPRYQIIEGQMKQSQEEQWQQLNKHQQAFEHEVEQHPQETQEQMKSVVSAMNSLEMLGQEVKEKSEVDECETSTTGYQESMSDKTSQT